MLQSMLGIEFDPEAGRVLLRNPTLPASAGDIIIRNLTLGDASIDFAVRRDGQAVALESLQTKGRLQISLAFDTAGQGSF